MHDSRLHGAVVFSNVLNLMTGRVTYSEGVAKSIESLLKAHCQVKIQILEENPYLMPVRELQKITSPFMQF